MNTLPFAHTMKRAIQRIKRIRDFVLYASIFLHNPIAITAVKKVHEDSLLWFSKNHYSEVGQDGVIGEILRRLEIKVGKFVEFGAWDGINFSNCRSLYERGWLGVFIESDSKRYQQLVKNYPDDTIITVHSLVIPGGGKTSIATETADSLDNILELNCDFNFVSNIDLISVDIDGYDLEVVMQSEARPKVFVIEGGTLVRPDLSVNNPNAGRNQQHSLSYICAAMKTKGYQIVAFNQDAFFVRCDLVSSIFPLNQDFLTPQKLYLDMWHYRGARFKLYLMKERQMNTSLVEFETMHFGSFHPNPLKALK